MTSVSSITRASGGFRGSLVQVGVAISPAALIGIQLGRARLMPSSPRASLTVGLQPDPQRVWYTLIGYLREFAAAHLPGGRRGPAWGRWSWAQFPSTATGHFSGGHRCGI